MVARATQRSWFNWGCIIGAPTPFWELITRTSITVYFGWVGLSVAGKQARWALDQDFTKLATVDLVDFTAETVDAVFYFAIAILIVMRYRRVAATGGLYPRLVALLGSFLFLLLVPFLPRHELSPAVDLLSIILMFNGSILATVVLLYLGRSFSILPEARRIVVTGPYRFIRHPLYATEMICMLGLLIQFALWPAVIVFLIQVFQLERMRIEEELLNRTFPEYEMYANNTARIIPRLGRCNHCGGQLGLIVHRNRMRRFCSKACKKAYEHKEEEERCAKDRHLTFLANAAHSPSISAT